MELTEKQQEILYDLLMSELKKIQHFAPVKSNDIIEIAVKSGLTELQINNLKSIFKQFNN